MIEKCAGFVQLQKFENSLQCAATLKLQKNVDADQIVRDVIQEQFRCSDILDLCNKPCRF